MSRSARLLGEPLALHDVRDVEAHVRVLLDARLNEWGARLGTAEYDDALTYLIEKAWELSGLNARGQRRIVWYVRLFADPEEIDAGDDTERFGPFTSEVLAKDAADRLLARHDGCIAEVSDGAPPGAFDPTLGLSFSTYSRRILSARVVDWYRQTFGDARYGKRLRLVSLDGLIAESHDDDEGGGHLDRRTRAALTHDDPAFEEVLTRVAFSS